MGVLDGKTAIVTGASRGHGAAIAMRFGAEQAPPSPRSPRTTERASRRCPGTIAETAAAIRPGGGTAVAIPADLAKPEDRQRLVDRGHPAVWPRWTSWSATPQ